MELKLYLRMIYKKLWLVVLFVLLAGILAGVKSYYLTTPLYQANAKLLVNQTSGAVNETVNMSTLQTNIMLISSYKEIIKSPAILNQVAEKYPDLHISGGKISVISASNSQIMNLVYSDTSYANAAKSVNAISNVFKQEIPSIMKIDNVTILSEAIEQASPGPINMNPTMNFTLFMIIGLALSIGLIFLLDYLDNTYKTEAELERDLGLPTLALVTNMKKEDLRPRRQPPASTTQKVGEGSYAPINQ